jgi:Asp-tRNA(Asn)/Glu-tRNA(Gln) amidotransferase A subunit family amidase
MSGFREYDAHDALGLAALIAKKQVGAAEVLEAAIGRVEAANPRLNAVVHKLYDEALSPPACRRGRSPVCRTC